MDPADIGLPPPFSSYRRGQEDAILALAASDKRFSLLSACTGAGKSAIYMSVALLTGARTLVLTSTKQLQLQLGEFASIGLVDVRGQGNYRCVATNEGAALSMFSNPVMCNEGPCHINIECALKGANAADTGADEDSGCLYRDAVRAARRARLVVTNYAYWMTVNRYAEPGTLGEFDLIVLDEAHSAPDELASFCAVELERNEVKALLGLSLPPLNEGMEVWVEWAQGALAMARARLDAANAAMVGAIGDRRSAAKTVKRLKDLRNKLTDLSDAYRWRRSEPSDPDVRLPGAQTDWVAEETAAGALFSPVWAHAYAEQYLFRGVKRIILTSAVLQKAAARYLGIEEADSEFIEMASTFDPARRPLIYVPTTKVDRNMNEGQTRQWVNRIDSIIAGRLDRNGIIQTCSYDRAREILKRSKYAHLMITHSARTTRDAIAQFRAARPPCVLVSPSVEEGHDFPYDLVRYQIIAKVPFVDNRSALMQARIRSDKTYSNYLTALRVIQQVGRGMRAEDDWAEAVIVDDNWRWWRKQANGLFPTWFRAAWRDTETVPKALEVETRSVVSA